MAPRKHLRDSMAAGPELQTFKPACQPVGLPLPQREAVERSTVSSTSQEWNCSSYPLMDFSLSLGSQSPLGGPPARCFRGDWESPKHYSFLEVEGGEGLCFSLGLDQDPKAATSCLGPRAPPPFSLHMVPSLTCCKLTGEWGGVTTCREGGGGHWLGPTTLQLFLFLV